jgi:predicted nucleic acid-binding protein
MIVLDTNVTSELMKPAPSPAVISWVRAQRSSELYTTAITVAEIGYGIERLPDGRRKSTLQRAADDIFSAFAEQVLAFDAAAAQHYGQIVSHRDNAGHPIDGFDAQIASICRTHDAVLDTRNVTDFDDTQISVIDPWSEQA